MAAAITLTFTILILLITIDSTLDSDITASLTLISLKAACWRYFWHSCFRAIRYYAT